MSWLHYLIEANIYLGVFYLCYCLLLNRDTHYMLGRTYLILSCILAFILPVTQLSILKPVVTEIEIVPVQKQVVVPVTVQHVPVNPAKTITINDVLIYLYITGALIALAVLVYRLRKLYLITRNSRLTLQDQYKLINLDTDNTAFSFFNYLFIGNNISQAETIIAHELVHIRQKHSADIIFLEIIKIVNWFNPLVYLLQRSLKTVHEYIADEQTAALEQDTLSYSSFLLNNAYGIQGTFITHSFFNYNLLKKRIIMLNKNRSGKLARLKYLAALPLCAGMLCTSTLVFSKNYGLIDLAPRKQVVIAEPLIDSTKYTLQVIDPVRNISATSSEIVFRDTLTGIDKKYTVNTLTEADQAELLKKRGLIIKRIPVEQTKTDTVPQPPPPPPLKAKRINKAGKTPPPPPPPIVIKEPKPMEVKIDPPRFAKPKKATNNAAPYEIKIDSPKAVKSKKSGKVIEVRPATSKTAPEEVVPDGVNDNNKATVYDPAKAPLILVNDKVYKINKAATGKKVNITTADSVMVYTKSDEYARKRWGDDAKNGVILLYGKPTFTIQ